MDNEMKEILNLILNKMDTMENKIDTMQKDITEIKADVKANYQELLTLDKKTAEIQNRLSNIKTVTAQNCYDITLLKEKQA